MQEAKVTADPSPRSPAPNTRLDEAVSSPVTLMATICP